MRVILPLACLFLLGCTPHMRETLDYAMAKERERFHMRDWGQTFREAFELDRIYPTYAELEAEEGKELCLHPNSQRRVVMQDGISDQVGYTWCVLAPYQDMGQRLDGRPQS